jgi:drug/metabolite transporter (DMT)-like permease
MMASSGIPFALLSALLFGASVPIAKLLLGSIEPWLLAGLLYLGSGLGLSVFLLGRRVSAAQPAEASISRETFPWLTGAVLFGGVLGPLFLMLGLSHAHASTASLLLNLESLATMAIAWMVFRENVDRRVFIGAMAILAGALVLSWRGAVAIDWGVFGIATACICWGIDNNLTRKIAGVDPVVTAAIKGVSAGTMNLALALLIGARLPAAQAVMSAAALGLLTYGVSLVFFILALRHLGAARTGAYYGTAPFAGAVLSIIMLNDPVTWQLVAAAGLMATGVWLHVTERHEHRHVHKPMIHDHRHVHDEHHQHRHGPGDPAGEPHSHPHQHGELAHSHAHFPDLHHRHHH